MGSADKPTREAGPVAKIFLSLFFLAFFGMGSLFVSFMAKELFESARTYGWGRVECRILESSVVEDPDQESAPYERRVRYTYDWNGETYTSSEIALSPSRYSDYTKAAKSLARWPVGATATAFVHDATPPRSVLEHGSLWLVLFLPIPLIFVVIGGGGLCFLWMKKGPAQEKPEKPGPISEQAGPAWGWAVLFGFFSIFLIIGAVAFTFLTLRPLLEWYGARSWVETPCTVISSRVQRHSDDDGTTYRIDILYQFEINSITNRSSRYRFASGGASSGRAGKQAVVNQYPPGRETTCWVDPQDPLNAALKRELGSSVWFGLIPLVFVIAGVAGTKYALRQRRNRHSTMSTLRKTPPPGSRTPAYPNARPIVLRSTRKRVLYFLGSILMALFWNGIVSVFLTEVVRGFIRGRPQWFLTVFMIPFVLVGIGMIIWVGYSFLRIFAPAIELVLGATKVTLGSETSLQWQVRGAAHQVRSFRINLEGREQATYQRGTRSVTDKSVFAKLPIVSHESLRGIQSGQSRISVPVDTMHSFHGKHNRIIWTIRVRGEIDKWPDINDEFSFEVLPFRSAP